METEDIVTHIKDFLDKCIWQHSFDKNLFVLYYGELTVCSYSFLHEEYLLLFGHMREGMPAVAEIFQERSYGDFKNAVLFIGLATGRPVNVAWYHYYWRDDGSMVIDWMPTAAGRREAEDQLFNR